MSHDEDQSGAESSSGPATKVRRARIACLQCRNRRTRCDAEPPRPCQYCIQNNLKCEWPSSDTVKKRGRKSSQVSTAQPLDYASMDPSMPSSMDWWSGGNGLFPDSNRMASEPLAETTMDSQTPLGNLLAQYDAFLTDRSADGTWMNLFNGTPTGNHAESTGSLHVESPYGATEDPMGWMNMLRSPLPMMTPRRSSAVDIRSPQSTVVGAINYTRSHGASAVVQGPEELSLNIHRMPLLPQSDAAEQALILQLVDIFTVNYGCMFPAVSKKRLQALSRAGTPSFLLDAVAAIAAKFTDRRAEVRSHRYDLGEPFRRRAMSKLGAMMGVPKWETISALTILAWESLGSGSPIEAWMLSGMALRMCVDMGLHRHTNIIREERLAFWSALITEYLICLAEGRRPSVSTFAILQQLPPDEECVSEAGADGAPPENPPRHPFPFLAAMLQKIGPLIDAVNSDDLPNPLMAEIAAQLDAWYSDLNVDIAWNAANLQLHHKAGLGTAYLFLHILTHAVLSLRFLLESSDFVDFSPNGVGVEAATPFPRWLHSPRFIGDMLVLGNLIDPKMVLANPFFGQCFYLAGKAFVRDRRVRQTLSDRPDDGIVDEEKQKHLLFRKLADHNIGLFRQALASLATHWRCLQGSKHAFERCLNEKDADAITAAAATRTNEKLCMELGTDIDVLPDAQMTPNSIWSNIFPPTTG